MTRTCSTCQHWHPEPPQEWRPSAFEPAFRIWELRRYLAQNALRLTAWPGACRRYPQALDAVADYGCAEYAPSDSFVLLWAEFVRPDRVTLDNERLRLEVKRLAGVARALRARLRGDRDHDPRR